jgi:curved DNA-binding protein CbpA
MKTTLYELLGLTPAASEADIHAAHIRLVRHYEYGPHGLDPVDAENRIKLVKEAWWTLSDPGRRAAYEASLHAPRPAFPPPLPPEFPAQPLQVEISGLRWTPARIMLTVIGGLMIVGMVIQILFSVFAFRQVRKVDSGEAVSAAAERVAAQERRQTYGNLSDEEIAAQEAKARAQREEEAGRQAELRAEYQRKTEESRKERALQERTYYADQVSANLQRAEEDAQRKAEFDKNQQAERERREAEQEQARVQERLARERQRWQQELRN